MNTRTINAIKGRLSLRAPQAESLESLARALEAAPDMRSHERDLEAVLSILKSEFPTLKGFERGFPSLCFALATGVGKTRLMGAFISYLHLAYGFNNFFVLAPNLTIYNKLITDFTPNTPKYVFKGIAEFAIQPPEVVTGDNYERGAGRQAQQSPVTVNIFNISKINTEVRGGKSPRIKRLSEYLGESYFSYLASLPDLVLLMDESHRYRASAGVRAIEDLKPLFGLELTATPFVESSRAPVPFRNVVVDYPLARAMKDGFVKESAVVTQRNFDCDSHTTEEVERIKLEDGVRVHESTKAELITYARQNDVKPVKPFMLIIARDTTHAGQLLTLIQSDDFFNGRYADKVIQVDSSTSAKAKTEKDDMIERLLAVESDSEPTEIVIHVNMLKEGWDVTNLYTIVPLRAAKARTLIEQSIGRGLRLPYGKRTGVDVVDRLNIIAHDRFQEIVDEANRGDSPIRLKRVILEAPDQDEGVVSVTVRSGVDEALGLNTLDAAVSKVYETKQGALTAPVFAKPGERAAAVAVMDVIHDMGAEPGLLPNSRALSEPKVCQAIIARTAERLMPAQGELLETEPVNLAGVVAKVTEVVNQRMIDIPQIVVMPVGEVAVHIEPFVLDTSGLKLQPTERELIIHELRTDKQQTLAAEIGITKERLEDYIVGALVDFDDIDYRTQSDLLYDLAGQAVAHFQGYLSDHETRAVLHHRHRLIAESIHAQMMKHSKEEASDYEVRVTRGFTSLKPSTYTVSANRAAQAIRETLDNKKNIRKLLFGDFQKCLYSLQKFDSDSERRFALILERDADKWFRPVKGQFHIYYKHGAAQAEYVPDFVAEAADTIYMVEIKAQGDMEDAEVLEKAAAAVQWCGHASDYSQKHGGKPWVYLLIPHGEINESRRLADFGRFAGNHGNEPAKGGRQDHD